MITTWENELGTAPRANAGRPLTRSLDLREEGLAMHATRTCSVTVCDRPVHCRGWCNTHYMRWLRTGSPDVIRPSGHQPGAAHPLWRGNDITYTAAHLRLAKLKGSAAGHRCADCSARAVHWSYDHRDPDEITRPGSRPYSFSTKPEHYQPRCSSCHVNFDNDARRAPR